MRYHKHAFAEYLTDVEKKPWKSQARRIVARVEALRNEGLDLDAFMNSRTEASATGKMVLDKLRNRVGAGRMTPGTHTQFVAALNAVARYAGYEGRLFGTRRGPTRRALPTNVRDVIEGLRRFILVNKGLSEKTATNHCNAIAHLHQKYGFDAVRFCGDDLAAQDEAEAALMERQIAGVSPASYNDDVDAMRYLAEWHGFELALEKRHETYRLDPDPAPLDIIQRLLKWRGRDDLHTLTGRAAAQWFLASTKRPGESSRIDLSDFDLAIPTEPSVKIRKPGKRGTIHTVILPAHLLSSRRPFGALHRWRRGIQRKYENGKVRMTKEDSNAFWICRFGVNTYARVSESYLTDLICEMARDQGVRITATRLRKTALTAIANGPGSDFFDATLQANHRNANSTRAYVFRSPEERRRRLRGAQFDPFLGPGPDSLNHPETDS